MIKGIYIVRATIGTVPVMLPESPQCHESRLACHNRTQARAGRFSDQPIMASHYGSSLAAGLFYVNTVPRQDVATRRSALLSRRTHLGPRDS